MTFKAEEANKKANFYKIKEGSFRLKTTQDDPKAVARPYTNPKTKSEGVAYERVFPALSGLITNVYFSEFLLEDGTRLKSLNIKLGEDEEGTEQIVTVPEDSRFAGDFLSKLPNINLGLIVRLAPFDFEKDGPRRVGISVTQDKGDDTIKKIENFFVEKTVANENTNYKNLHGYPEATDEDKSDWPFYYKKVNKFLVQFAKTNILPKFDETKQEVKNPATGVSQMEEDGQDGIPTNDINPDDIPF